MDTKKLPNFVEFLKQAHEIVIASGIPGLPRGLPGRSLEGAMGFSKSSSQYTFRLGVMGDEIRLHLDCTPADNPLKDGWAGRVMVSWPSTHMNGTRLHAFLQTLAQVSGLAAQLQQIADVDGPYGFEVQS